MATSTRHPTSPYVSIIDLLPFQAALVDTKGHVLYRNEAHRQHLLEHDDAMSQEPDAPPPGMRQMRHRREVCAQVARSRKARFHSETVRTADGTAWHYRWLCLPLHDEQGTVAHVLVVELDYEDTPEGLSDRELEVFEHIGHGRTTQEIAEVMLISPKTVESYRARIKEKLSIEHNTELIRRAVQWVEGGAHPAARSARSGAFFDELTQEIRSPLAAIAGLAGSLAQRAAPEQAHLADLILTSTEHLIRRLDRKVKSAQRQEERFNRRGVDEGR